MNGSLEKRGRGGRSQVIFRCERPPRTLLQRWLRDILFNVASTPPFQGGECRHDWRRILATSYPIVPLRGG